MQIILFHGTIWVQGIFQFGTGHMAIWDTTKRSLGRSKVKLYYVPNYSSTKYSIGLTG